MAFDPYAVLKVPRDASVAQIEEAYEALVEIYDPARFGGTGSGASEEAARRMRELRQARAILLARREKFFRPRRIPTVPPRDLFILTSVLVVVLFFVLLLVTVR